MSDPGPEFDLDFFRQGGRPPGGPLRRALRRTPDNLMQLYDLPDDGPPLDDVEPDDAYAAGDYDES